MKAIKDTGNNLVAALDKADSVGIIDSYFPAAAFFTEFERFDRFIDKWHRDGNKKIEYISIKTNYKVFEKKRLKIFTPTLSCPSGFGQRVHRLALCAKRCSLFFAPAPLPPLRGRIEGGEKGFQGKNSPEYLGT